MIFGQPQKSLAQSSAFCYDCGMRCRCALSVFLCLFCACTLDYRQDSSAEERVPEFSFTNGAFSRYDGGTRKSLLLARRFERYKNDPAVYCNGVRFFSWSDNGELQAEGSCGTLSADMDSNDYALFDDIVLKDVQGAMEIRSERLRYSGKTEQLTSGKEDFTTVARDDISISGRGFSASGISRRFSFADSVEGRIVTGEDEESDETGPSF